MLKCLVTLNISGCSSLEYVPMDLDKVDSLRELYADEIAVHQMVSTAEEVQPWYGFLRSWMCKGTICPKVSHISLPNSLVTLSLAGCNLSDNTFPVAFNSLSLLRNLDLSHNNICSLPKGISYLTRLQKLQVEGCEKLKSLIGLPNIEHLNVTNCSLLEKISYQSKSSSLKNLLVSNCVELVEIDGNFKLEPLRNTEAGMLCKLGLLNLAPMDNVMINLTSNILSYYRIHGKGWTPRRKTKKVVLQVCPAYYTCKYLLAIELKTGAYKSSMSYFFCRDCTNQASLALFLLVKEFLLGLAQSSQKNQVHPSKYLLAIPE